MTPEEISKLKQRMGYKTLPSDKKMEVDAMLDSNDADQHAQASDSVKEREMSLTNGIITGSSELMDMGALLIEPEREDGTINVGKATSQAGLKMAGQGATMGASVGTSIMPGIGTGIGAAAGAIIGGVSGMVTGNKKAKHINKKITSKRNVAAATRIALRGEAKAADFMAETPQYLSEGGFVKGSGGPTDDSNSMVLEKDSFVIPSIKNIKSKSTGKLVKKIAKAIGESGTAEGSEAGKPVKVSDGELIIPKNKVQIAEAVANESGTTLEDIASSINSTRKGMPKRGKGMFKGGYTSFDALKTKKDVDSINPEVESIEDYINRVKYRKEKKKVDLPSAESLSAENVKPTSKGGKKQSGDRDFLGEKSDYTFERVLGATQTLSGLIGTMKEESRVRKNLARQDAEVEKAAQEEGAAAFAAKASKRAAIERGFSDSNNSIERLKKKAIKDLAQNSMTTQEFSNNYAQTAAAIADKVGDLNTQKTAAILNNESEALNGVKDIVARRTAGKLTVADRENELSAAKLTQSALLQKSGVQNLISSIQSEKSEVVRRRRMRELIRIAREQGIALDQLAVLKDTDWNGVTAK